MVKKVGYVRPRITAWETFSLWSGFWNRSPHVTVIVHMLQDTASIRERHQRAYMKMHPKGFGHRQRKYIRRRG